MDEIMNGFKFGIGLILAKVMMFLILFLIICFLLGTKILGWPFKTNNEEENNYFAYVELDY